MVNVHFDMFYMVTLLIDRNELCLIYSVSSRNLNEQSLQNYGLALILGLKPLTGYNCMSIKI